MIAPPRIFDTALVRHHLARAVRLGPADFLLTRTVEDIGERLDTLPRSFTAIADIGTPLPTLAGMLAARWPQAKLHRHAPLSEPGAQSIGDLEHLPLPPESLDLAVSVLALQCVNDLPGVLVQIRRALRPDGLFLGAMPGGKTLQELRAVLTEAESDVSGRVSPRVAPFADVRDMGGLLQRAGFALPVADSDLLTVRYDNLFALMADLRAMGATNPLTDRAKTPARRAFFWRAAELYQSRHADADGRIRATFEIISLSGWAPHESQQKPAKRGSGQVSLAAVLGKRGG